MSLHRSENYGFVPVFRESDKSERDDPYCIKRNVSRRVGGPGASGVSVGDFRRAD